MATIEEENSSSDPFQTFTEIVARVVNDDGEG